MYAETCPKSWFLRVIQVSWGTEERPAFGFGVDVKLQVGRNFEISLTPFAGMKASDVHGFSSFFPCVFHPFSCHFMSFLLISDSLSSFARWKPSTCPAARLKLLWSRRCSSTWRC